MRKTILQDGKIFHETFTGSYIPETTLFGNPKINLDFWGNPVIKTDIFGNQIVEIDFMGNPVIPVEYPNISDIGSRKGTASGSGDISSILFSLLPYILLAGGLYSVFATLAGSLIFVIATVGLLGMLIVTSIADHAKFIHLSNGIQQPFYVFSMGWVFGIIPFWINFFFSMNFDVSNTNYLTWDDMMTTVFPQMGLSACIGIVLGTLFAYLFRSDMFETRRLASQRDNRHCVFDMLVASVLPPILAVGISLAWFVIAIIADLFWKRDILDKQATVMAIAFVILGIIIVARSSSSMVTGAGSKARMYQSVNPVPAQPIAEIRPGKIYTIRSDLSNLVLDAIGPDAGYDNGNDVGIWEKNGKSNQRWMVLNGSDGYIKLMNMSHVTSERIPDGKVIDVDSGEDSNGAKIQMWDNQQANHNQELKLVKQENGSYLIATRVSCEKKCLDIAGWQTEEGSLVHQWDIHGGANQQWYFDLI